MKTRLVPPDDPALRRRAEPVKSRREAGEIGRRLVATLAAHNKHADKFNGRDAVRKGVVAPVPRGIGLAAPQIGIAKQVCVFWNGKFFETLVNPRIASWTATTFRNLEGCLSFPGLTVEVPRYRAVEVWDDQSNSLRWFGGDFLLESVQRTACVQHEIQHLYGIVLEDAADPDLPTPDGWEGYVLARSEGVLA